SDEDQLEHHPSDADFYNADIETPIRPARSRRSTKPKNPHRTTATVKRVPPGPLRFELGGLALCAGSGILLFNALRPSAEGWLPRLAIGAMRYSFGSGTSPLLFLALIAGISMIWRRHRFNGKRFG